MKATLKDERTVDISVLSILDLEEMSKGIDTIKNEYSFDKYAGFDIFAPVSFQSIKNFTRHLPDYNQAKGLTPFEINLPEMPSNMHYHKVITALSDDEPVGVSFLVWRKYGRKFWHYSLSFIDVRKDFRNAGLATAILDTLDVSGFMENKILEISPYLDMGLKYLKGPLERILTGKTYAVVPELYFGDTPERPGIYGIDGDLKQQI